METALGHGFGVIKPALAHQKPCAQCAFWLRVLLWATRRARLKV